MNDLLRRKESSHVGDIGVTEVNKNAGAVWTCVDQLGQNSANSHFPFEPIPRLDPPPPSGKKRLPRALKTTRDMMISSDPVVSSPDAADLSSSISAPLIAEDQPGMAEDAPEGELDHGSTEVAAAAAVQQADETSAVRETEMPGSDEKVDSGICGEGSLEGHAEEQRLHLSVPDLINKNPPIPEARAKSGDVRQKPSEAASRMSSAPRSGKARCRLSPGEEDLSRRPGGVPEVGPEDSERHPDLLSFE